MLRFCDPRSLRQNGLAGGCLGDGFGVGDICGVCLTGGLGGWDGGGCVLGLLFGFGAWAARLGRCVWVVWLVWGRFGGLCLFVSYC